MHTHHTQLFFPGSQEQSIVMRKLLPNKLIHTSYRDIDSSHYNIRYLEIFHLKNYLNCLSTEY